MAGKTKRNSKKIICSGLVQGVGFRPAVLRLARQYGITGMVKNCGDSAELLAQGTEQDLALFCSALQTPGGAYVIKGWQESEIAADICTDFCIAESTKLADNTVLPADTALCPDCLRELKDQKNRRYAHPLLSCTVCGPRFTVLEQLPYDRQNTSMCEFELCPQCAAEYGDVQDRRCHAQTISCQTCGPYLIFDKLIKQEALEEAVAVLQKGGIIAVKGIGGYHFACVAANKEAIRNLRRLKGRERKPFAVMFPDINVLQAVCEVGEAESKLLESPAAPIVLLPWKQAVFFPEEAAGGSLYCGAFLPYTAIQVLLTEACGPLIMTSANLSGEPIIKDDTKILALKSPFLSGVLYHERRIVRSVDDTVIKTVQGEPYLLRRGRGYVPLPVICGAKKSRGRVFAAGGDLKYGFCFCRNNQAVLGAPGGDLADAEVFEEYKKEYSDFMSLLGWCPKLVVCDSHPRYYSAHFARQLGIPVLAVQHHHAHIAAVLAEYRLMQPVIGLALDGTGYGTDGCIWGGEFLLCEGGAFERLGHFGYVTLLGGDSAARDARRTAECYLTAADLRAAVPENRRAIVAAALANDINTFRTSSVGRLFDAVSALLGIGGENSYEGECAGLVEREAVLALRQGLPPAPLSFILRETDTDLIVDQISLISELWTQKEFYTKGQLALGFHRALAEAVTEVCLRIGETHKINIVACGGGVFQNSLLTEQVKSLLSAKGFTVYLNKRVPVHDGGLSFGQAYLGLLQLAEQA